MIHLTDLFDLQEIQDLQDSFSDATGVASIITEADGTPITQASNFTYLCFDIIRKTPQGLANCYRSDAYIGRQNFTGPTICHCLSGGLWDAGASISLDGQHIANWLIGQVRDKKMDTSAMLDYGKTIGADLDAYRDALQKVPIMEKARFSRIADCLFLIARELSTKAWQNLCLRNAQTHLETINQNLEKQVAERSARLVRTERLASLGKLVSGLAHELATLSF